MRSDFIDLKGRVFGRWTVKEYAGKNTHNQTTWLCRCECGNEKIVRGGGKIFSKSCGCLQKEKAAKTLGAISKKHGSFGTPLYGVWAAMKRRCQNKRVKEYKNYGGRGIAIYSKWNEYGPFEKWALDNGFQDGLTIDRIDNNGNYDPDNCRWIPISEQQRNRRNNIFVMVEGEKLTIAELARKTGILDKTLYRRYGKGARTFKELTKQIRSDIGVD